MAAHELFRRPILGSVEARENTTRHRVGMAIVATALGVTGAAAYEIDEFAVDTFLGQHLFISEADTANDLFDGFAGGPA